MTLRVLNHKFTIGRIRASVALVFTMLHATSRKKPLLPNIPLVKTITPNPQTNPLISINTQMKRSLIHAAIVAERNLPCAFKLRPSQIDVLLLIKENRLCYLSELCNATPYDRSTITKAVAFLSKEVKLIQEYAPHSYVLTDAGAEYCLKLEELFYSSL